MEKVITIVLPTYNRKSYLEQTLSLFESQVIRNANEVSLVISNNASDDGTDKMLSDYYSKKPFFDYVNHANHVEVGESILRTNDLATSEFVLMWGDDDYPYPYMVDLLLSIIKSNKDVSLIHFNRLYGKDGRDRIFDAGIQNACIREGEMKKLSVKQCIDKYILDMSFLTSVVFRRSFWVANKELDCSKHYGYEFLGHILHGMENERAIYIDYPMCVQRKPVTRPWMQRSPMFRFIGIPNMYADFEKWGLTEDAHQLWMRQGNTQQQFIAVISQAAMYKSFYRPLFKEIISHQDSLLRKLIAFAFIYLCPSWLYSMVRRLKFKEK